MAVRKTYNIPLNQIFENLEGFPAERFVEVMAVVQSYCQYWDMYFTDEGFVPPAMTEGALSTWNRVKHILKESNSQYYSFVDNQSEKGQASAAAREEKKDKAAKERQRYVDKRDEILAKRRQKYADEQAKKKKLLQTKTPEDSLLSQADQEPPENSTAVDRLLVIGLNNNTIKNHVVIEDRGAGERGVIHNPAVDSSENNYQSSGLTGNNPPPVAMGGNNLPAGKGNNPHQLKADAEAEGNKQQAKGRGQRASGIGQKAAPPSQPSPEAGEGANNSARKGLCRGGAASRRQPYRWQPGAEVVVDENFDLDFLDPEISDLNFIYDWLINGVVAKIKLWKMGKSIHKKWVRNLIFTFAKNQGYGEELAAELYKRSKGIKK